MAIIRRGNVADFTFETKEFGIEDLLVVRFEGAEAMSELYRFVIELRSDDPDLDLEKLTGKPGALLIRGDGDVRRVMGQVSRAEHAGVSRDDVIYVVELVPAVWYLTLRQRCRIHQEKSVPDIVKEVLDNAGIPSDRYRFSLSASYNPKEISIQYRETDWDFISRLLEEEGIFYFFDHTEDGEVLVMGDSDVVPVPVPDPADVEFHEASAGSPDEETVHSFRYARSVRPGATRLMDFNFKKPKVPLDSKADSGEDSNLEIYDYPGRYAEAADGKSFASIRLEELRASLLVGSGEGRVRRLIPGFRVTLENHPRKELNQEYVITRVMQRGFEPESLGRDAFGAEGEDRYMSRFQVIPASVAYRPPRVTPRPIVPGVQTAIVVGPSGEEIYTDEYGRVKVRFPWDLEGKYDDKSSCWIRASQAWAGGQYGAMFIPRIGQEVIVDFLEGDPDRPIITGRVYNAEQMPPYALPGEKTKSTLKSNSSTGGGGYNEIRFEDKAGDEQIWIHAQKDVDERVENDVREWVGNDKGVIVKGNLKTTIHKAEERAVGGDRKTKIGAHEHRKVEQDERVEIGGWRNLTVGTGEAISILGDRTLQVDANSVMDYGGWLIVKSVDTITIRAPTVNVSADQELVLTAGGSVVKLSAAGVDIQGAMVKINCGAVAPPAPNSSPMTPDTPSEPGSVPEAGDDEPGEDTTFSGGEEISDPLEIEALAAPHHRPESNWQQDPQKTRIDIELLDDEGVPVPGEHFRVILPDGSTLSEGRTDLEGKGCVEGIDPGQCRVVFPNLDKDSTGKK